MACTHTYIVCTYMAYTHSQCIHTAYTQCVHTHIYTVCTHIHVHTRIHTVCTHTAYTHNVYTHGIHIHIERTNTNKENRKMNVATPFKSSGYNQQIEPKNTGREKKWQTKEY